jgi:adenylate kinase family enzyme
MDQFDRVAVVGTSCAGKTTMARELAARLNVPHIELDALYWGPHWTPIDADRFRDAVNQSTSQHQWVCDGNYSIVRNLVWRRATAVVWLNYSFPVVFGRALRRTLKRCIYRSTLFAGNRESFAQSFLSRDSILLWVLRTHWQYQREYPRLFAERGHSHLYVVEVRTRKAANGLLEDAAVMGNATGRRATDVLCAPFETRGMRPRLNVD